LTFNYLNSSKINQLYPYAVNVTGGGAIDDIDGATLTELSLNNITDYIYWRASLRFKDESNAIMYKLVQNI
jgi:hypothetical protein